MTERRGARPVPAKEAAVRPTATISPARAAAFELLQRIGATSVHSDDALHGPRLAGLSQPDKDLTTALVLGVLRWQIALDARLRPLLSRPDLVLAEPVAIALRLAAFQLLHLERIPAHAALNESVELVRAAGHNHAAGMVNAVLRNLQRTPAPRKPLVESLEAMAERLGHPLWLAQRWVKHYGRGAVEAICGFDQQQSPEGDLFADEGKGAAPLMDAGSRLVAELAAASKADAQRVWDCCAAPGGKTLVMAGRLPDAQVLATDTSSPRLRRLEQRLQRALPERPIRVLMADAEALPEEEGEFDLILCDVPCSGTGTLARNPEIRHRLQPAELRHQAERQVKILRGAMDRLALGGRLVYSTCSLEPEENEAVLTGALEKAPRGMSMAVLPVGGFLERLRGDGVLRSGVDLDRAVRGDFLRTLPGFGFTGDGFFAAVLERV